MQVNSSLFFPHRLLDEDYLIFIVVQTTRTYILFMHMYTLLRESEIKKIIQYYGLHYNYIYNVRIMVK